jgi:hypothetical protein
MTLDFLFENWINECLESFLCADSVDQAKEYFEDGLEPWELENLIEDQWTRLWSY